MKTFEQIVRQLVDGEFELTRHALQRIVERNISGQEIRQAAEKAVIIEDYPDDKYAPSCLILGFTRKDRPLHLQVSYADTNRVRIITIYQPDPGEWVDFSKRR